MMEALHIDFDAPLEGEARKTKVKELASQHEVFHKCREAQGILVTAQQKIRRINGVPVHDAEDLSNLLITAGQNFNIAVKDVVEEWAELRLQSTELKNTISNWGKDNSCPPGPSKLELQEVNIFNYDLICALQAYKEKFESIQYEKNKLVAEFERFRNLSADEQTIESVRTNLVEKIMRQIEHQEGLFSLLEPFAPALLSPDNKLIEKARQAWLAKRAEGEGSHGSKSGIDGGTLDPFSPNPAIKFAPGAQSGRQDIRVPGSGHSHSATRRLNKSTTPGSRLVSPIEGMMQQQLQITPLNPNNQVKPSSVLSNAGALVKAPPLKSPFIPMPDGNANNTNRNKIDPPQRTASVFNFATQPKHIPKAVPPAPVVPSGPHGNRFSENPNRSVSQPPRPQTAFRPDAAEFRPGPGPGPNPGRNMVRGYNPNSHFPMANYGEHGNSFRQRRFGNQHHGGIHHGPNHPGGNMNHPGSSHHGGAHHGGAQHGGGHHGGNHHGGNHHGGNLQGGIGPRGPPPFPRGRGSYTPRTPPPPRCFPSQRPRAQDEGPDAKLVEQAKNSLDEFYTLAQGWVKNYAGECDTRQAVMLRNLSIWSSLLAACNPLNEEQATAYVHNHLRDPLYRQGLIVRLVVNYFVGHIWVVSAWTGFDNESDKALEHLKEEFATMGTQSAFHRQRLLNQRSDLINKITSHEGYDEYRTRRIGIIKKELSDLTLPLLNRFTERKRAADELEFVAEQGWEASQVFLGSKYQFQFRFPEIGGRFTASCMRPVFPNMDPDTLQTQHWRVSLAVSPSITCIRDTGTSISAHEVIPAEVVCMQ